MKEISIQNDGRKIFVDNEDYIRLSQYKWYLIESNGSEQIITTKWNQDTQQTESINIGRVVLQVDSTVDHKDINPFNNQKYNLRKATRSQNNCNKKKYGVLLSSMYKGVTRRKRSQYESRITINKKTIGLGRFKSAVEAAKAYNEAALKYHGEFAYLNKLP